MTDDPTGPAGDDSGASDSTGGDRPDLVAGEAAAIARFGEGPALFSADIPAPRHPHVGPLLPHRRVAVRAVGEETRADPPSGELVLAPRHLPARPPEDVASLWRRLGHATRRGVEVAVDWTARGVVATVTALGAAAHAVVTLVFGPERPALPEGRRR